MIAGFAIVGTFLSTWLVGRYIEKPLQSWLRKIAVK
jgi:peptidoglycan/LPS O-acetylase OafA/YrhL